MCNAPVISIDGPAASGKGTIATTIAEQLGFHYLDSGKLYRAAALAQRQNPSAEPEETVIRLAAAPEKLQALLQTPEIIADDTAREASILAAQPAVRTALVGLQRAARRQPGLVADGRDMGSVIFPDAVVKVFLTASLSERAVRRQSQLLEKYGINATIIAVGEDLRQRDERDSLRAESPLKKPPDAVFIDSTRLSTCDVVKIILTKFRSTTVYF